MQRLGYLSRGLSETKAGESALWNEANVRRIVKRLSRMRGAAQKLGQILSIQDANVLPPQIERILFDIQHAGTRMPSTQLHQVLAGELGHDWRNQLAHFEELPVAAASIGQVHWARDNDMQLAVKVQYPGVADAIDSDLDSLKLLLLASRLLPRGLYLEKTIEVARRELRWETDYLREAHYMQRFRDALRDSPAFRVPEVKLHLSTTRVLTMERLPGVTLSQTLDKPRAIRNWIATQLLHLSLREVFEFKFMQTDPNWSNFLFDGHQLGLLDFGATREFDDKFLADYLHLLKAGVAADRAGCIEYSLRLGYLTGDEHQAMAKAHVDSILTLAEPFRALHGYDFSDQTITSRIRGLIPTMLSLRLTPPPEPTYSLHRKLSGAFLLCARLGAHVDCKRIFEDVASKYRPSQPST
ncbi:hypothetical protein L0F63_007293 [Massospora cicadina]|nr:hypothetical protein L0F63_007293 [Massospora cicadina]